MGGDSSHQVGLLVLPLETATRVHGKLQQCTQAESTHAPLAPCEAQNASKSCSDCQLKNRDCIWLWGKFSSGYALHIADQWVTLDQH